MFSPHTSSGSSESGSSSLHVSVLPSDIESSSLSGALRFVLLCPRSRGASPAPPISGMPSPSGPPGTPSGVTTGNTLGGIGLMMRSLLGVILALLARLGTVLPGSWRPIESAASGRESITQMRATPPLRAGRNLPPSWMRMTCTIPICGCPIIRKFLRVVMRILTKVTKIDFMERILIMRDSLANRIRVVHDFLLAFRKTGLTSLFQMLKSIESLLNSQSSLPLERDFVEPGIQSDLDM